MSASNLAKLNISRDSTGSTGGKADYKKCFKCFKRVTLKQTSLKKEFCPFCSTHLVYYEDIDIRTLVFETVLCNDTSLRYFLFVPRFKLQIESLSIALLAIFLFLDVAFKFKLYGQNIKYVEDRMSRLRPPMPSFKQLESASNELTNNSIFELYIYSAEMRAVINVLIIEGIIRLAVSVGLLWSIGVGYEPCKLNF